jgi:hypothetical protein
VTLIDVKPRVLKNYLLKIGADNYEKHVSGVTLTPSGSIVSWQGAHPEATFTDSTPPTWAAQLDYAQDWETANSLSVYLMNHEGEHIPCEFSPLGSGPKFTATLVVTAGTIGGVIGAFGTASVTCGVDGKPKFTAGAVAAPAA